MKRKLFLGGLGGALGGLAMKAVVRFVDPASFGLSTETDAKTACAVWRRMNWEPPDERKAARIGAAMHYGFAIGAGALYGATAERLPALRAAKGAAFGAALWLVGDEAAVSLAGLENPCRAPISSHLSALGAHILYGLVVEAVQAAEVQ